MYFGWEKNENVYTTQSHYRFNAIPNKISILFSSKQKKNYPRISEEPQKTPNSQRNFDKEGQRRKPYISHFSYQSILQNYSSQNSTVVA